MTRLNFEDVAVGNDVPVLTKGPISTSHIMRWSSAIENWHRIHYDWKYATEHDKLPDIMVAGSWKQNVLMQLLSDWVGDTGWLWKINFQFRDMNLPGETLHAWGRVVAVEDCGDFGTCELEIGLRNDAGKESAPGKATVVLPKAGGKPVPYPFNPELLSAVA